MSRIGLVKKYNVTRVDGRCDGPYAEYFVLRMDNQAKNQKASLAGIRAYAAAIEETHPYLAADIWQQYGED
jgi:hypothetical protein